MKILITGNVGSGKSTFLKFLKKYVNSQYYEFIDLDVIAKSVIRDYNITLPDNKTNVFEHPELLFSLENEILPHLEEYFPVTNKTLIMEASTLIECPTLLNHDDIVIHVSSKNSIQNTFNRDKVENRAFLISRVQISPWIKNLICEINVENNSTLEDFELVAKNFSEKLNEQKTEKYLNESQSIVNIWHKEFNSYFLLDDILKKNSLLNSNDDNSKLLNNLTNYYNTNLGLSDLWHKALIFSLFYKDYNEQTEKTIQEIWIKIKDNNLLNIFMVGSRSYISLASELLYTKDKDNIPNNLNFGDGLKAINYLKSI